MSDVVVVESPAKAKTIEKYLGRDFTVLASYGHVRDLEEKDGAVLPDQDFAMLWGKDPRGEQQVGRIAAALKGAKRLYLATDPDREGEAISWHLAEVLRAKKAVPKGGMQRITFNAITKDAVQYAMANPRDIDQPLVDAYLARRALDYLVGYHAEPRPVAQAARGEERWTGAVCRAPAYRGARTRDRSLHAPGILDGRGHDEGRIRPSVCRTADQPEWQEARQVCAWQRGCSVEAARAVVEAASFSVSAVELKNVVRNPSPPFTTSTLQHGSLAQAGSGRTADDADGPGTV
jgi:DNA topoisomerase I